jgi:hypothetical protein
MPTIGAKIVFEYTWVQGRGRGRRPETVRDGVMHIGAVTSGRICVHWRIGVNGENEKSRQDSSCMPQEVQRKILRLTCPPCGEVFTAENEDRVVAMAVEHARKLHDINLLERYGPDEFRALVRRENDTYWARIAHLIPDGQVKTVLDEKLCDREREIVSYVVPGFRTVRSQTGSASANGPYPPIS